MNRAHATYWGLARAAVLTAALGGLLNEAGAAESTPLRVKETLEVDSRGDLKVREDVRMPAGQYTRTKTNNPNLAVYLRRDWQEQPDWLEVRDFQGSYDDGASTIHFQWSARGAVRPAGDRWEVPLFGGDDAELISTEHNVAILRRLTVFGSSQASVTVRVVVPAGGTDLRLAHAPARLTFKAPPAAEGTEPADPEFTLDVKPQVMSCLAKAYANPRFDSLWVARATLSNDGGQAVKDYRVRFRIKGYTENWSDWESSPRLAPGQAVVDPYFPLFDLARLAPLEGPQQADLEAEYEYETADGRNIHKSETHRLKILDRNQALASSLPEEDATDWYDQMNYLPYVLSAFVTHDDPVIQQTAGWVSGQADGAASALSDDEALKFMAALFDFMNANQIAYQTPPVGASEGAFFQHVKYGRDVLKNKAGTCIDLAIFYASVCDAVGLEPLMVPTDLADGGHCFPVIRLPSGRLVPVETTLVGHGAFDDALKRGQEVYDDVRANRPYYLVKVREYQNQGCSCMELPKLPATALRDWGVVNANTAAATAPKAPPAADPNPDEPPEMPLAPDDDGGRGEK